MSRPTTGIPQPPPEATTIKLAREARGLSVEEAAARVPIRLGATRWRQIKAGYERREPFKATRAPAATLAHMARLVGVDAERLDEDGRKDAGDILREMQRQQSVSADVEDTRSQPRPLTSVPPVQLGAPGDPDPADPVTGIGGLRLTDDDKSELEIWMMTVLPWQTRARLIQTL